MQAPSGPFAKACSFSTLFEHTFLLRSCAFAGSTKSWDHCCLVHALWLQLAKLKTAVWVLRVPTKVNIADNPSRRAGACKRDGAVGHTSLLTQGGLQFAAPDRRT